MSLIQVSTSHIARSAPLCFRVPPRPTRVSRSFHNVPFPDRKILECHSLSDYTFARAKRFPTTLANYWRVAQVMQRKGLIPFVHGRKASWIVSQRILESLGHEHCRTLRGPGPEFAKGADEIMAEAKAIYKRQKLNPLRWLFLYHFSPFTTGKHQLDHQTNLQRHLLSVTLGAFHGDADETPFNYVFGGEVYASKFLTHDGNRSVMNDRDTRACIAEMVSSAMKAKGYHDSTAKTLLERSWTFYDEAAKFPVGQLVVLGVPLRVLHKVVYQSKPFGIPTGVSIQEVVKKASDKGLYSHEYQARVILCKESMDVNSGIDVISIMDEEAVGKYCEGIALSSPWEDEPMKKLLKVERTDLEDQSLANFRDFYKRLDQMLRTVFN